MDLIGVSQITREYYLPSLCRNEHLLVSPNDNVVHFRYIIICESIVGDSLCPICTQ